MTGDWFKMKMTGDLYERRVRGNLSDPDLKKKGGLYEVKVRDDLSDQEVKVIVVKSFALRGTGNWSGQEMKMTGDSSEPMEQQMIDDLSEMKIVDDWFGQKMVTVNLFDHEVKPTAGWSALEMKFEMTSGFD